MILVTGATGNNGSEIVKLLAAQNVPVRAMVRDRNRAGAIALPCVEVVEGDFECPETLLSALSGVERASWSQAHRNRQKYNNSLS